METKLIRATRLFNLSVSNGGLDPDLMVDYTSDQPKGNPREDFVLTVNSASTLSVSTPCYKKLLNVHQHCEEEAPGNSAKL